MLLCIVKYNNVLMHVKVHVPLNNIFELQQN